MCLAPGMRTNLLAVTFAVLCPLLGAPAFAQSAPAQTVRQVVRAYPGDPSAVADRLQRLKDERHGMVSGIVTIVLAGTGLGVLLFLSIPLGALMMIAAVPFGIFWLVAAGDLDHRIEEAERELREAVQPVPQQHQAVPAS